MSFFSVITINYNNLSGLRNTFASVVHQTFPSFEFIVIDGESTDGSKEFILANESKVNYWISEKDSGVYHAMNKGIQQSNSAYLIFLNSGDCFASEDVLLRVKEAYSNHSDILYGCHLWKNSGERWNPKTGYKFRDIVHITPVSHQATFYKKEVLIELGSFDESNKIISDWAFFIKALLTKKSFQKISLDICIAEEPGESNVSFSAIQLERKKYLLKKHFFRYFIYLFFESPVVFIKRNFSK